ncbi:hypothetical protein OFN60_36700, partial [Escherichia coli]|nr:hypothetical protein [Escherichia coli]
SPQPIVGFLQPPLPGAPAASPPELLLTHDAFAGARLAERSDGGDGGAGVAPLPPTAALSLGLEAAVPGRVIVYNTLEEFKAADRHA